MKIINYIILFVFCISLFSCEDKLELFPTDEVDGNKVFETIEGTEKAVLGVYSQLSIYTQVELSDLASDDLRLSAQNTGQGVQAHNWTYTSGDGEFSTAMTVGYHTADRANRVLQGLSNFDENDALVKQLKGELYFLRAFAHFDMARIFCNNYKADDPLGLPYMKESTISNPARLPQSEFYTEVLSDLDLAATLIPSDYMVKGRANLTAINALKARVALYQGNWTNAISAASAAIGGDFVLANSSQITDVWKDANDDDVEVIFKLLRTAGGLGSIYNRTTNDDIFFHPSYDLQNQFDDTDVRAVAYFGKDDDGFDIVVKHIGRPDEAKNTNDYKVFRVSEMYLIRAEAYISEGGADNLEKARADLNEIITKRGGIEITDPFTNATAAMDVLMAERRKELAYEGHRFYDLRRWNLGVDRIEEDTELASGKNLPAGDYHFVFPIPQSEIFANENMDPNPGYTN
ncbi:RagB/SusD family nutrient uptake outer membrane protein [Carboxylicivirga mesophila]|uniref:RagB/SusD family nutrient uptake outer membrane protein n=1 Tax=Carboxylicivirga mesophila TaxID=1166478 RepID=A0ABS5KDL8_9BACT|nr:RagB/SusD family nutrient uptake outer membrane protein [Carboxylicivirga mesophila]MBS2213135.1 RagB/SusD family nutrient uptake outer membrane protein [Carboxylicivirga mesophila]